MKKHLLYILFSIVAFICSSVYGQQPFYSEVQRLKKKDSIQAPPQNPILFIGSSSFTKWQDVQTYFPQHTILNKGFGGSRLVDVIHYADDVIYPYKPKQVVIYAGENDIAYSDTVTALQVLNRVKSLFYLIRGMDTDVPIAFISIKPSVARQKMMPRMEEANKLIKRFLRKEHKAAFVNVYDKMLLANGDPDPSIFIEDKLHMNAKGYAIWQKILEPYLLK